jgi:hypothetical protein
MVHLAAEQSDSVMDGKEVARPIVDSAIAIHPAHDLARTIGMEPIKNLLCGLRGLILNVVTNSFKSGTKPLAPSIDTGAASFFKDVRAAP